MNELELQREVTRLALEAARSSGFALAGSGAIREHGVISRATQDVDLFTSNQDERSFRAAVDRVVDALRDGGYAVSVAGRRTQQFARLHVETVDGQQVEIDMGMDWREAEPVELALGPVLSIQDAIGNKVSALYSRAAARDFYDVDAIRASGHYTDAELIAAVKERDLGFEVRMFANQLDRAQHLTVDDFAEYGVDADQLNALKARLGEWATKLHAGL